MEDGRGKREWNSPIQNIMMNQFKEIFEGLNCAYGQYIPSTLTLKMVSKKENLLLLEKQ